MNENMIHKPNNNHSEGMEVASLVLGVIAISTCTCLYTGIICGSLATMFALLSRGGQMRLTPRSKAGLWLGIAAVISTIAFYSAAYIYAINQYGSLENLLRAYCDMTGLDFESIYGGMN